MNVVRICLAGLAFCAAAANAQSWAELDTLVFSAHRPVADRPLAEAFADPGHAMPEWNETLLERVSRLTTTVVEKRLEHGENSPELVDDLLELAYVHQRLGDHSEAIVALEQAQHIIRMHQGLYSLDQVAAVEAMIVSFAASNDYLDTLPLESYLQELVQRNPNDPRAVTVLTDIADRQLAASQHYLVNGIPPIVDISIGSSWDARWSQDPPTARQLAGRTLWAARRNYSAALHAALDGGYSASIVSDLLELEDRVIDTFYFELMNPGLRRDRFVRAKGSPLAVNAFNALDAKLQNSRHFPGTPEAVAAAMIEIADWQLLFAALGKALDSYRAAHRELVERGAGPGTIAAMFSPEEPVALPDFPARFRSSTGRTVAGWFDIDVEVSRYGRVTSLDVVGRSDSATEAIERRFRRHVYTHRFRPRFDGDELLARDAYGLRYHFAYEQLAN